MLRRQLEEANTQSVQQQQQHQHQHHNLDGGRLIVAFLWLLLVKAAQCKWELFPIPFVSIAIGDLNPSFGQMHLLMFVCCSSLRCLS